MKIQLLLCYRIWFEICTVFLVYHNSILFINLYIIITSYNNAIVYGIYKLIK